MSVGEAIGSLIELEQTTVDSLYSVDEQVPLTINPTVCDIH